MLRWDPSLVLSINHVRHSLTNFVSSECCEFYLKPPSITTISYQHLPSPYMNTFMATHHFLSPSNVNKMSPFITENPESCANRCSFG